MKDETTLLFLFTGDEKRVTVTKKEMKDVGLVQTMIADDDDTNKEENGEPEEVPLLHITEKQLLLIVSWIRHHENDPYVMIDTLTTPDLASTYDVEFCHALIRPGSHAIFEIFHELAVACDYLNFPALTNLLLYYESNRLFLMSMNEVKDSLGIDREPTPEEEIELRRSNTWMFNCCMEG
jgi:hypothetical protein